MISRKMRRLVLFDIDGTLSKSTLEHSRAFSEAFRKVYHIDASIDSINHQGMLDQVIIVEVLKRKGLAEEEIWLKMEECMQVMVETFTKSMKKAELAPLKGVRKLLEALSRKDAGLGLVTGNLEQIAREKVKKMGLDDYFKIGGFGSDDTKRENLVRLALKRAREFYHYTFDPRFIYLIGDTPHDINAAKKAKVKSLAVASGTYPAEHLRGFNPDYVLKDLANIKTIFSFLFEEEKRKGSRNLS